MFIFRSAFAYVTSLSLSHNLTFISIFLILQMSTDDQIASSYQVLTPLENAFYTNQGQTQTRIIDRILSLVHDRLDDAQPHKDMFNRNPMQPIIFDILREIKQKNGRKL